MKLSDVILIVAILTSLLQVPVKAEEHFTSFLFVDTYSAFAENKLVNGERSYFTQASRNEDYSLNLGAVGIAYDNSKFRAKLVSQYGDSVSINYNAEPDDSFKYVQESYLGVYFNESTYIDVGTFLAHIGAESWLSRDNLNYTRSYIAEFSPYYETGVRLSHKIDDRWSVQLLGINGWQNTTDSRHPALGTQVTYSRDSLTLTSNTFVGEELNGDRLFHNFVASQKLDSDLSLIGSIDVGYQSSDSLVSGTWWGYSIMAKQSLSDVLSLNGRFESYLDPQGVIVTSTTGEEFKAYGSSIGVDIALPHGLLLRGEVKHIWSPNAVFMDNQTSAKDDTLFVVSLSFFNEQRF